VSVAVKRLDGVESVELSLQRAMADIRLRDGNRITLEQIRQIVKDTGFTPKNAVVVAVGTPVQRQGKPAFNVSGIDSLLVIAAERTPPALVKEAMAAGGSTPVASEIAGTVELKADGTNEVVLTRFTIKR
jgi:hypothetical protein